MDSLLLVAVRLSRSRDRAEKIAAATPGAAGALNLTPSSNEPNPHLAEFLKLAATCERDAALLPQWQARNGQLFTLSNAGSPLPGDAPTVMIRLTPVRRAAGGVPEIFKAALQRGLTAREANVLTHVAEGASDRKIGEVMRISQHTARAHIRKIFRKLGVSGRVEAVCKIMTPQDAPGE